MKVKVFPYKKESLEKFLEEMSDYNLSSIDVDFNAESKIYEIIGTVIKSVVCYRKVLKKGFIFPGGKYNMYESIETYDEPILHIVVNFGGNIVEIPYYMCLICKD